MPVTYNGIGTHYYGRRNQEKRQGTCQQCGRNVELTSYDTRLWFVIVFIPVIPLGRKRIVDQCPACTRHYVQDLQKWETAKQLEISGALETFRSNPTPEAAIEAHQALVGFHQMAQAAEFREMMRDKFASNAKVQAYLGAVLDHLGRPAEAATAFERALELRPDLPEARVGVAAGRIREQRLDEARRLLDFLEKPGASQLYSLSPLETLAIAYQEAGRHEESLQLFGRLLEAFPQVADHTGFRKMVERSEKALKRGSSVLPGRKFSWKRFLGNDPTAPATGRTQVTWRGLAVVGALVAVILLGFVVRNEYVRRHRTIHVVNGLRQPVAVEIRGVGEVQLTSGSRELELPEGRHHATITGAVREELDFEVRSKFFDRWFNDPAWVINIGGAAVLVVTTATYSRDAQPPSYSFRFGQTFEYFPEITHAFAPLPETLRMKSHESRTLTQLEVHAGGAGEVFAFLEKQGQWSEALRLAESQLRVHPGDQNLLQAYVVAAGRQRQIDRAERFFQAGLTNRPVEIEWHRAYQSLRKSRARDAQLAVDYDAMLQAEPTNSALLYLRGRVEADRAEANRFFDRALASDPRNPFPLYARGYERFALGDWQGAKDLLQQAVALRPDDEGFLRYLQMARLGLREFSALEQDYRAQLKQNPLNFYAAVQLCDVLVAAGKNDDARQAVTAFERTATSRHGAAAGEMNSFIYRRLLYETGDFALLEKHAASDRSPAGRATLFQALLEQGRVADALKASPPGNQDEEDNAFELLTVALAWRLEGNLAEAQKWREQALTAFDAGDADCVRAAALLRRETAPTQAELDAVILPVRSKAILLAAIARQHPAREAELGAAARRLNLDRGFPHRLIQRATAGTR